MDVNFDLPNNKYFPYRKPNNKPLYINTNSNHPPTITKHLPTAINRRISDISCNKEEFDKAIPMYEEALKRSGYNQNMSYQEPQKQKRSRKRKIIWFNPPYSCNVKTNIRKLFMNLISKHFPAHHKFRPLFNKNNIKISYSCMANMEKIIRRHNAKILNKNAEYPQD